MNKEALSKDGKGSALEIRRPGLMACFAHIHLCGLGESFCLHRSWDPSSIKRNEIKINLLKLRAVGT